MAAQRGFKEIVTILLEQGCNIYLQDTVLIFFFSHFYLLWFILGCSCWLLMCLCVMFYFILFFF